MTTELVINEKLSSFVKDMLAKGFRQPEVHYAIKADAVSYIYISWRGADDKRGYSYGTTEYFEGDDFGEALLKASDWLDAQPTVEQRQFREFAEILGKAIEIGKQNGIDAILVNPLEKAMRDLSKNALMFQPYAPASRNMAEA